MPRFLADWLACAPRTKKRGPLAIATRGPPFRSKGREDGKARLRVRGSEIDLGTHREDVAVEVAVVDGSERAEREHPELRESRIRSR